MNRVKPYCSSLSRTCAELVEISSSRCAPAYSKDKQSSPNIYVKKIHREEALAGDMKV